MGGKIQFTFLRRMTSKTAGNEARGEDAGRRPYGPVLDELLHMMEARDPTASKLPFLTLTYAQALDGSIAAGKGGAPLKLSSDLSMTMTHELRAVHDGILVGIGTVLSDNPSLTTRLCEGPSPRPIILDSQLRCPPTAKFIQLRKGDPKQAPIVVYNSAKRADLDDGLGTLQEGKKALEDAGVIVVETSHLNNDSGEVFALLKSDFGLRHIMIEGGAQVIRWFILSASHFVDAVLVTVAPLFVGGLVPTHPWISEQPHKRLKVRQTALVQGDVVLVGKFDVHET